MGVLLAPHVTEKTSLAMQNHNQYTFRVRRDATKTDIKKAVELMFEVKVAGVQVVNEPGKTRRFGKHSGRTQDWKKAYVSLAAGQSIDYEARARSLIGNIHMALIKYKPTSPGTRAVVKVDRSHLHKGGPYLPLTELAEQDRRAQPRRPHHHAARRRRLAAEVPHHRLQARQGRHRRRRRAPRIRSEPHRVTSRWCCYADGERRYILAPEGREGRR